MKFMNQGYKILISLMLFVGTCFSMYAQEKTVTGTVTEEIGPIAQVPVLSDFVIFYVI